MKHILFALAITVPLGMAPVAFGQQTASPPDVIQGHVSHGDVDSAHPDEPAKKATPGKGTASSSKSTATAGKNHRKSTTKHGRKATAKSKEQVPAKKATTPGDSTPAATPK